MKIINLSSLEASEMKYKISQFPDGQQDIVIDKQHVIDAVLFGCIIASRFNSFRDLELIIATTTAMRRMGVKYIELDIPYLLGARSDRHFQDGGNSYLVDVIAPIINAQNYDKVTVLDVHSDVAAACIKNLISINNHLLVVNAMMDINNPIIISPDAGALKKIHALIENIGYTDEIVTASKHRDVDGNIAHTEVPLTQYNKDYVIIDDICDGGRTFIEIAKVIQKFHVGSGFIPKIYLIVTHGIFSAGYTQLMEYFTGIYTTNSIKNIGGLDGNSARKVNIHQLDVI
jgi:ribose-phosphate pyrophosphokinase